MNEVGIKTAFAGTEDVLTHTIIGVFFKVYNELGYGFLESVYRGAMAIALQEAGLKVATEVAIPVSYHGQLVGTYRADIIVEGKIVLELKIADQIAPAHEAQLLHYLRASPLEIGLILSFGQPPRNRRVEFRNDRKPARV